MTLFEEFQKTFATRSKYWLEYAEALGWPSLDDFTVGPTGACWVCLPGSNSVVRLLDGEITEYPLERLEFVSSFVFPASVVAPRISA